MNPQQAEYIQRAAAVAIALEQARAARKPENPRLAMEASHNQSWFDQLPPHHKAEVTQQFMATKQQLIMVMAQEHAAAQMDADLDRADAAARDMTKGVAGRVNGLTAAQFAVMKAGDRPVLKVQKLPTGARADALVRVQTAHLTKNGQGLTEKQYEKRLLHLAEMGVHHPGYEATAKRYFGDAIPMRELNKLVVNAVNDAVGIELQRRNEAKRPDTVTLPELTPRERLRMDVMESVIEHHNESGTQGEWTRTRDDNVRVMARDEKGTVRGAVAQAVLDAGGLDNVGLADEAREDSTDEMVSIVEGDDNGN